MAPHFRTQREFPSGAVGQVVVIDQSGVIHVAGETGLISTVTPAQPFASRILGIINAAGGVLSGRISPSEVISIFGFGLGPAIPVTAAPNRTASSRHPSAASRS